MFKAMFMDGPEKDSSIKWCADNSAILKEIRFKKWNVHLPAGRQVPKPLLDHRTRWCPCGYRDRQIPALREAGTHKIAITRRRIVEVNATQIKFRYKDYADSSKIKQMWITHQEFIRRFEQHILPKGLSRLSISDT
jgi:hypothetical protein